MRVYACVSACANFICVCFVYASDVDACMRMHRRVEPEPSGQGLPPQVDVKLNVAPDGIGEGL